LQRGRPASWEHCPDLKRGEIVLIFRHRLRAVTLGF
jgi:hypothetical protein